MKKTILLILSLVLGCSSMLSLSRISKIDIDQCELKETWENYNSTGMLLRYYECDGSNIATLTRRAPMWSKSNNMIGGINYQKYPLFLLDGYSWEADTAKTTWKLNEESNSMEEAEIYYKAQSNEE